MKRTQPILALLFVLISFGAKATITYSDAFYDPSDSTVKVWFNDNNGGIRYDLQISTNSSFSSILTSSFCLGCSYLEVSFTPTAGTTYYYRIKQGTPSVEYGPTESFCLPTTPYGLSNTGIQTSYFTANWSADCALEYYVQISPDNTWGNGNDCDTYYETDLNYTFHEAYHLTQCGESLQNSTTYYWRVKACKLGYCSSWASTSVTTASARKGSVERLETNLVLKELSIYPNPILSEINFKVVTNLSNPMVSDIGFKIYDQSGKVVSFGNTSSNIPLDVSWLSGGVYFINLESGDYKRTERFIKR